MRRKERAIIEDLRVKEKILEVLEKELKGNIFLYRSSNIQWYQGYVCALNWVLKRGRKKWKKI